MYIDILSKLVGLIFYRPIVYIIRIRSNICYHICLQPQTKRTTQKALLVTSAEGETERGQSKPEVSVDRGFSTDVKLPVQLVEPQFTDHCTLRVPFALLINPLGRKF